MADRDGNLHGNQLALGNGIFLDHDGIGAGRDGAAGEYPHTLTGADLALMGAARRCRTDNFQRCRDIFCIRRPHRIAIHGGNGHRRLGPA